MAKTESTTQFERTSFLWGGNAPFIEDLYARYLENPEAVDPQWRAFFGGLGEDGNGARSLIGGLPWQPKDLKPASNGDLAASLAAEAPRRERIRRAGGQPRRRRIPAAATRRDERGRATRDPRFGQNPDDDPRLPDARPSRRRPRSPEAQGARAATGARSADLRLRAGGHGPADLHRQRTRPREGDRQAGGGNPPAHLLLDARRRVHAHLRSHPEGVDPGTHRGAGQVHHLHAGRQEGDPQQARRDGRLRAVPERKIHRHEAVRNRRRRIDGAGARTDHQARRRAGRERDRARHGASRPAQRPRQRHGQAVQRHLPRVQGRFREPRGRRGFGRRQVSSRLVVGPRVRRKHGAPVAHRQSVASRDRRSGGAGQGAGEAGPARRRKAHDGAAAPHPRRCRLRRPRRGSGVFRALRAQGPPRGRLHPLHRQQPDRVHDEPHLRALLALSERRRQDDRSADLPRQRRRSRSGGVRREDRGRVPAEVPQAGGGRHVLLPAVRSQRVRRAVVHAADDVQADRPASDGGRDLFRATGGGRRDRGRRRRADEGGLPQAARREFLDGRGLPSEQGRLAGRALGPSQGHQARRRSAPRA